MLYVDPDFRPNPAQATPRIKALVKGGALDGLFVHGFGEDADGELYVLASRTGTPSGNTGMVLKIVRP